MKKLTLRNSQGVLFSIVLLLLLGCNDDESKLRPTDNPFPEDATLSHDEIAQLLNAKELPPLGEESTVGNENSGGRTHAALHTIRFDDPDVCLYTPEICNSGLATWPGYIEKFAYATWGYCWLSYGPHTNFIPSTGGSGYYVSGYAFNEQEHEAQSITGSQWFAYKMKRSSSNINFDLTEMEIKGPHAITLWFKDANNVWWYWPTINPGIKNFGSYTTNIQEFHVSTSTGNTLAYWTIDNIKIRPR